MKPERQRSYFKLSYQTEDGETSIDVTLEKDTIWLHSSENSRPAQSDPEDTDVDESDRSCGWRDGTYSATVDYYNPENDFSNTYTLDVEVEDCQVIQINFPSGGWLDEDHISPADIDPGGEAEVEGEDGKTYRVHLEEWDRL
jgi:hypothetical protein